MKTKYTKLAFVVISISFAILGCGGKTESANDNAVEEKITTELTEEVAEKYGGTYSFGDDIEKVAVGEIRIYPVTKSSALFYLDVNRGAPSYNMGMLSGEMIIDNNVGIYESKEEGLNCKLTFEFIGDELKVSTEEGKDECGFGHAVYADNIYKRTDKSIPQYYLSGEGDTLYFESLLKN